MCQGLFVPRINPGITDEVGAIIIPRLQLTWQKWSHAPKVTKWDSSTGHPSTGHPGPNTVLLTDPTYWTTAPRV